MKTASRLLALIFLTFMCSCKNLALHQTGRNPEDFKPFTTVAGEPALLTATWRNWRSPGQFEVMRLAQDAHFQPWLSEEGERWEGFHPYGLSVVQCSRAPGWEGKTLVYAVNSADLKVWVFDLLDGEVRFLTKLGAAGAPELKGLNAVAALPSGVVFATQYRPLLAKPAKVLHWTTPRNKGDGVVRFVPNAKGAPGEGVWTRADTTWGGANGIAYDATRSLLLVAGFTRKQLHIVPVEPESGELEWTERRTLKLPGNPDNLALTAEGTCLANCVPGLVGALVRLGWERVLPPLPYLFRPARAVEVQLDPACLLETTSIPRCITQPATTWREGSDFYTTRIFRPGVFRWRRPSSTLP
jgi:hypothetical protein